MTRNLSAIGVFAVAGVLLGAGQSIAQTVGKQTDLNKANQLIQQLQKHIAERDRTIQSLNKKASSDKTVNDLKTKLNKANQMLKDAQNANADLTTENDRLRKTIRDLALIKKAPYVHSVILKMKKDNDDEQIKIASAAATKSLLKIDGVRHVWVGKRSDIGAAGGSEKEYHMGVVVFLDNAKGLQSLLDDPLYKQFTDKLTDYWTAPTVYDLLRDTTSVKK